MTTDYEAGDINTIAGAQMEVDFDADTEVPDSPGHDANRAEGATALAVLTYIARSLADDPESVAIETLSRRGSVLLRVHVGQGDMGRVIGRRGRTAQAIRTLVAAAGAKDGVSVAVDIADD
ncbi:MAG: KH domain-containing protein [Acidimicrobiales bacterium]